MSDRRQGWAALPKHAVVVFDRRDAFDLAAGLDLLDECRRRDRDVRPSAELRDALMEFAANDPQASDPLPLSVPPSSEGSELWTMRCEEAAARLDVSDRRVRQLLSGGRLRGIRNDDGHWRIDPTSVEERCR